MKKIISTEKAPAAIGPYSQAVEVNGFIFTSGVIPIIPETGELVQGGIEEQADQAARRQDALEGTGEFTTEELEAALDALEPLDSQIVRMKYYEGLSY